MMTTESTRMVNISRSNLDASIAQFLYAMGALSDKEDVASISIGTQVQGQSIKDKKWVGDDIIPLTIKLKKHQEVKVIQHNG